MHVRFHQDVDAADAVKGDLDVLVVPPVAHPGHVRAFRLVLLVACGQVVSVREGHHTWIRINRAARTFGEYDILVESGREPLARLGFLP